MQNYALMALAIAYPVLTAFLIGSVRRSRRLAGQVHTMTVTARLMTDAYNDLRARAYVRDAKGRIAKAADVL